MKHTLLIIYILVTSGSLVMLHKALRASEDNIETLAEVLTIHEDTLSDHRGVLLELINHLKASYL